MPVDVTARITITRPRAEVGRFATNPANDREWIGGIREVEVVGDGPIGRGTQVRRLAGFLGRRIEYVNQIDAYDPERLLDMHSIEAPFPMQVSYRFEENGSGTTLATIRVRGDAGRFYRIANPLLEMMVRRNVRKDLERLKTLLESRPSPVRDAEAAIT